MALMLSDLLVVFDNLKHTVTILANVYADERPARRPTPRRGRTIEEVRARLAGPLPAVAPRGAARAAPTSART